MFARHGIQNALRTRRRSVAFLLLMTLLVTLLGTSLGLSFALQETLRQCRENYSTIGLVEYLGPGYPSTTKVVADAGEVLAEFEESWTGRIRPWWSGSPPAWPWAILRTWAC